MKEQIELFIFIASTIYVGKYVFDLLLRLRETNPAPLEVTKTDKVLTVLSISYILTFLITSL